MFKSMYYLDMYIDFVLESFAVGILTFEIQYCYLKKKNIYTLYILKYINNKTFT